MREAVDLMWLPRLEEFKLQMIFVSAGFDAYCEDDMANMGLVEDDYGWITEQVRAVAKRHAQGRIVSCLEADTTCRRSDAAWPRICAYWRRFEKNCRG